MRMLRIGLTAAVAATLSACTKEPEPFDVARVKGSELLTKNEFAGAAVEYEKSLELNPEQDVKVWDRAAFANMKAGRFDRAAELLERSLAKRSEPAAKGEALRNIAGMYLQQASDSLKAEQYFQKAVDLDPKDEQALSWLAEISSQRGGARQQTAEAQPEHLKMALLRYDAVLAVNPAKADPYINKRIVLVKYIDFLSKQKASLLAEAESQKKDKAAYEDLQQQAADTQTRIDELKGLLELTSKKLGEINKPTKASPTPK